MKKYCLFFIFLISVLSLSACSCSKLPAMDQLTEDGIYPYRNDDLGFTINLPAEFKYFQIQRKDASNYIDIEFFIPTTDKDYVQEVPDYAKPIVIRIFQQSDWQGILKGDEDNLLYEKIGEKGDRVFTIQFWQKIPADWADKWNEEMRKKIVDNFEVK